MDAATTLPADADQAVFAEAVGRAERDKARIAVMRDGRAVAFIVPVEDAEALDALDDAKDAQAVWESPEGEKGIRNIQVIEGAQNCTFSIFQATRAEFALLFPEPGQDIQYAQDLTSLPHQERIEGALAQLWERPIRKQNALGIHGTLFYELDHRKAWYREKREDAVASSAVNRAQRRLFGMVP